MSHKKKKNVGRFTGIPHAVMSHPDYFNLSGNAIKLLLELAMQYNGRNNGKLCAVFTQLKLRGWNSEGTLDRAKKDLLMANLIVRSKVNVFGQNGKSPTYYALTWQPIDEISQFSMDIAPTITPIRKFQMEVANFKAA